MFVFIVLGIIILLITWNIISFEYSRIAEEKKIIIDNFIDTGLKILNLGLKIGSTCYLSSIDVDYHDKRSLNRSTIDFLDSCEFDYKKFRKKLMLVKFEITFCNAYKLSKKHNKEKLMHACNEFKSEMEALVMKFDQGEMSVSKLKFLIGEIINSLNIIIEYCENNSFDLSDETIDYYKIIGVKDDATTEEIRKEYLFLTQVWHPDKFRNDKFKHKAEMMMKLINEAYHTLTDPDKRKLYDQARNMNKKTI